MQLGELIKHDNRPWTRSNLFYSIEYSRQTRLLHINLVQKDDPIILLKPGDYLTVDEDASISERFGDGRGGLVKSRYFVVQVQVNETLQIASKRCLLLVRVSV